MGKKRRVEARPELTARSRHCVRDLLRVQSGGRFYIGVVGVVGLEVLGVLLIQNSGFGLSAKI